MKVSVVVAFPDRQQVLDLQVASACTAREAVSEAIARGLDVEYDDFDASVAPLGIYGERVADDKLLVEGDRVEIYRPLQQDPMELRRKRALESGSFSRRRK